jgi:hypothetical protein
MHIREIFDDKFKGQLSIGSQRLTECLCEREDWPWGEWRHGKAISPHGVASSFAHTAFAPNTSAPGTSTRVDSCVNPRRSGAAKKVGMHFASLAFSRPFPFPMLKGRAETETGNSASLHFPLAISESGHCI